MAAPRNAGKFAYPRTGWFGVGLSRVVNSQRLARLRRAILTRLPFMTLRSDVRDVVYLNWVIPVSAAATLLPAEVRVWECDGKTILTILSYRHGHFGPALAGPLRRLFPSPLQSNWRLYVDTLPHQVPAAQTVLFIHNLFNSIWYAAGSRLFSDALPSHLPAVFTHQRSEADIATRVVAGQGSAAELHSVVRAARDAILPPQFSSFFTSWADAVARLCLQESAVAVIDGMRGLAQAGIDLPIALETVIPMVSTEFAGGEFLRNLGVVDAPFCFMVPRARFTVLWERLLPI